LDIADAKFKDLLVLPTLELDNGLRLFSPAAIAKYLLVDEGPGLENIKSLANAPVNKPIKPRVFAKEQSPVNASDDGLKDLIGEMQTLSLRREDIMEEINKFYNKLRLVEDLVNDMASDNQNVKRIQLCKRIQTVLCKTIDGQINEDPIEVNLENGVEDAEAADPNEGLY